MNREETKKAIEVMQVFAGGADVEYRYRDGDNESCFRPSGTPVWYWMECEYRIKPKPRELWLYRDDDREDYGVSPIKPALRWNESFKVREIVE